MSKRNFILFLGVWIIFISLSGVPGMWKTWLLCATGSFLIAAALLGLIRRTMRDHTAEANTFVESQPEKKIHQV